MCSWANIYVSNVGIELNKDHRAEPENISEKK